MTALDKHYFRLVEINTQLELLLRLQIDMQEKINELEKQKQEWKQQNEKL